MSTAVSIAYVDGKVHVYRDAFDMTRVTIDAENPVDFCANKGRHGTSVNFSMSNADFAEMVKQIVESEGKE